VRLARDQEQLAQKQEQVVQQALLLLRDRQELDAKIQVIERFLTIDRRPEEGT